MDSGRADRKHKSKWTIKCIPMYGNDSQKVRPLSDPQMVTELQASLEVRNRFHTYVRYLNFTSIWNCVVNVFIHAIVVVGCLQRWCFFYGANSVCWTRDSRGVKVSPGNQPAAGEGPLRRWQKVPARDGWVSLERGTDKRVMIR